MEKLAVLSCADFIDRRGIEVCKDATRNIFAAAGLVEEDIHGTRITDVLGIRIRLAIRPQSMLEQVPEQTWSALRRVSSSWKGLVQLPSAGTQLRAGLSEMDMTDLQGAMSIARRVKGTRPRDVPLLSWLRWGKRG